MRRSCATFFRSSAARTRPRFLIDDRPVPYARELWLPLVWFLIRGRPVPPSHHRSRSDAARADLKQLEAEYNMFFAGRLPKPPWETRARVEALVKQYDRGHIRTPAIASASDAAVALRDVHRSVGSRSARARGGASGPVRQKHAPSEPEEGTGGSHPARVVVPRSGARDRQAHELYESLPRRGARSARKRRRSTSSPSW
jgi:hypothetical protein